MPAATFLEVRDETVGTLVADRLRVAATHWSRLRGLLGTSELAPGAGLWITPCRQIHMVGMRYAVDAVFLDADHRVVLTVPELRPGKTSPRVREAASVLELPAGTIARARLLPGSRLTFAGEAPPTHAPSGVAITAAALLSNAVLATMYLLFILRHAAFARRTGAWATTMPLVLVESVLVLLALTRRRSTVTSQSPLDWAAGIVGTLLPLLMRATETTTPLRPVGEVLQIVGVSLVGLAVAFLGRSFGIVPAHRGIKTVGAYAVVRHPMYAAYMLTYLGYVLVHASTTNVVIVAITFVALALRAALEERLLATDPTYETYCTRIRWRFMPYVY